MLIEHPYVFWIILTAYIAIRMLIPRGSKIGYFEAPSSEAERKEYSDSRNQNMVLASFTIVAIAIIISFKFNEITQLRDGLYYLSIGMFLFFIASYLFTLRRTKWLPYTAETLEYTGIIALAIGLLYLISGILTDLVMNIIYIGFFIGILAVAIYEAYLNKGFFHPKSTSIG